MTIRIVTDSTCDLPEATISRYGITVVPLYINIGVNSYLDGVDLSHEAFYKNLAEYNSFPTTAAPGPESFRQVYETLANEGATEILSIHVSGTLSATLSNARLGAQAAGRVAVTVFDSRQISYGVGFLAITAANAAVAGRTIAEIVPLLEAQVQRTHLLGILDTLEFLRRSGRAGRIITGLGSLLSIKPVFQMYNGQIVSERVRTRKRAIKQLIGLLNNLVPLEQAALLHSHTPERVSNLHRQIQHLLPADTVPSVEITPILGAHLGPGGVGIVCISASKASF